MIKCVAIDDEPIALSIIRKYCEGYGGLELRCFDSPLEGIEYVITNPPHILFLDIGMQPINGLELARRIPNDVCLIFTTAFGQYAMEGFELNAIDYLQKPFLFPRFEKAMNKAKRWLRIDGDFITLSVEHQKVRVNVEDIIYVEAMDNYIKIFRNSLPTIITLMSMKEMLLMLPENLFARIHRSYIVAIPKIESIGSKGIRMKGIDRILPIGRTYLQGCRNLIK